MRLSWGTNGSPSQTHNVDSQLRTQKARAPRQPMLISNRIASRAYELKPPLNTPGRLNNISEEG